MEQHIASRAGDFTGDAAGFENLFRRSYSIVFSVAIRITRNPVDAHDVVQSVFCKLWASQSYARCNTAGWLSIVTRNAAIDHLRKSRREYALPSGNDIETAMPSGPSAEQEALQNIERGELVRAVEKLGNSSSRLLFDSFIAEQSHRAIAFRSALPLGTVKSRLRATLKKVRRLMTR